LYDLKHRGKGERNISNGPRAELGQCPPPPGWKKRAGRDLLLFRGGRVDKDREKALAFRGASKRNQREKGKEKGDEKRYFHK